MKKKMLFIVLMTIIGMKSMSAQVVQKDPDPVKYIKNCVLHGIPMVSYHDLDIFLLTLYGNESFCNEIGREITDSAKSCGIVCTFVYRVNMLDFDLLKDSLRMTYHVWFKPNESEGSASIRYYLGKWSSSSDYWMMENMIAQTKSQPDARSVVSFYSDVVVRMMDMDLWIPHKLTTSLSYNFQYCDSCLGDFEYKVFFSEKLSLIANGKSLGVSNTRRIYSIKNEGDFEQTFEVAPKWSSR